MGILNKLLGREKRADNVRLSDPYLAEFFGMDRAGSVDRQRASGLAIAQACVGIIAQGLAGVPLNLYRDLGNAGREKATDHPLFDVLNSRPNATTTGFEFRESMLVSLLVNGNAFARVDWNTRGQVEALHPLHPATVAAERLENGRLRYKVSKPNGSTDVCVQEEMLHIRYRVGPDGVMGQSPITLARETFGVALSQQDAASTQAARGNRPGGIISFPERLSAEGKEGALGALERKFEGNDLSSRTMVLDAGASFTPLNFSPRDAEFVASRKLTNEDICRVWLVPPTTAGILDHGTYSNVDGESKALVVRCLAPMAKRIEQAMNHALLTTTGRQTHFIEHDLAGLLRGDQQARFESYRIGREWGWLSANEIRSWENLPHIDGGDEYMTPLNMASPTTEPDAGLPPEGGVT